MEQYIQTLQDFMVMIRCYTYNHSAYITDALNGFTVQQTNFPFVIVLVDDASTDGEQGIIQEYIKTNFKDSVFQKETDYANITFTQHVSNKNCYIAAYLLKENHYSQKKKKKPYVDPWRDKCKYEALCEGDDYWTDSLKLEKQVVFLESNPDFSMCFHKVKVIRQSNNVNKSYLTLYNHLVEKEYTGEEILGKWTVPTASVLYKIGVQIPTDKRFLNGDIIIFLSCIELGRIFCLDDVMGTYRRHEGGISYKRAHYKKYIDHYDAIIEHFGLKYKEIACKCKISNYVKCLINSRTDIKYIGEILKDVYDNKCLAVFFITFIKSVLSALMKKFH